MACPVLVSVFYTYDFPAQFLATILGEVVNVQEAAARAKIYETEGLLHTYIMNLR